MKHSTDFDFQHRIDSDNDDSYEQVRVYCCVEFGSETYESEIKVYMGTQEVTNLVKVLDPEVFHDIKIECERRINKFFEAA